MFAYFQVYKLFLYLVVGEVLKSNVGLLLVTASQAFFSLMNVFVKKLNSIDPPVSTFELIAVRMIITYVFSMAYMIYAKVPDPFLGPKGVRLLLVFRGFPGTFFGLLGIYYSLQYLSLSDATVLTFLAPLCTGICGAIFLKERYTAREAFASIFSLFGVVLIARPAFLFGDVNTIHTLSTDPNSETVTSEQRLIAVGVSLIGVLGATGAYTSITAIGKRAHPLHAMTSFSSQCVIVAVIAMIIQKTPIVVPTEVEWLALLILIGVFGFIAQVLLTMGLQRETAGRASTAVYTQVVFAAVLERIFFQTTPSILSVIGTVIIITAALYVAVFDEDPSEEK
ncbi:drug/metabolite transporter superfamily [Lyophyllum atratum]|nr:drug/metabolite transporter superfamily [Lyophyllum atratum]